MATQSIDPAAWQTALTFANPVRERGAEAVVLVGDYVRGASSKHDVIELIAIGDGPGCRLVRFNDFLVSLCWAPPSAVRAEFRNHKTAARAVQTWREAIFLLDPDGTAAWLQAEANAWDWDKLEKEPERHAADELTLLAEPIHRLVGHLEQERYELTACRRSTIALGVPRAMALFHRLLYSDDDVMTRLVGERMGERWMEAQAAALGLTGEPLAVTCRATLELYALATVTVREALAPWQRDVVEHAVAIGADLRLPGHPSTEGRASEPNAA